MYIRLWIALVGAWLLGATAPAEAAPACTVSALNGLLLARVNVTEAKAVAATAQTPAHCQVFGTVLTRDDSAPDGEARFSMQLPDAWRQRFLLLGVGGNAGTLGASANGVDRAAALGKGYAVILTDTGHVGDGTTAKWARKPDGSLDAAKVADFFHRAAHAVTVAGKAFTQAYYAGPILHAYFDGCSTGGRMALVEAERYPGDYTGVIAGDPSMDFKLNLRRMLAQKAALKSPQSYIPEGLLAEIDARVTEQCDAMDGAKDGLVQNPSLCTLRPMDLVCKPGMMSGCLNPDQAAFLSAYIAPLRDKRGRVQYPGWPITNLSGAQGTAFYTTARTPPNLREPAAPWGPEAKGAPRGGILSHESLAYYLGEGPAADINKLDINPASNLVGDDVLVRMDAFESGDGYDAAKLKPFIAQGGKLILYHGASDPSIPAERTIMFYRELTALLGGREPTQKNVRLFLVPGMHHCGGGVGPDQFDTLTALESWVEQGQAPTTILATTRSDSTVQHRLPLCPYPEQAKYSSGALADERNWKCVADKAQ